MPSITVRDIPADVHERLRREAESHGRSLNREILVRLKVSLMERPAPDAREILAEAARTRRRLKHAWLDDRALAEARRAGRP